MRTAENAPVLYNKPTGINSPHIPVPFFCCCCFCYCAAALLQLLLNIPEPKRGHRKGAEAASWTSPLLKLDEEDGASLTNVPDFLFTARCLVYCDLFTVREEKRDIPA